MDGSCFEDMWEMRCIFYSNGKQQLYWIPLSTNLYELKPPIRFNQRASDFNKRVMYMWGGSYCVYTPFSFEGIWGYNLTANVWKHHKQVIKRVPDPHLRWSTAYVSSFFYSRLDSIVTFSGNLSYALKSLNRTVQIDFIQ